jgi:hypothetical protein
MMYEILGLMGGILFLIGGLWRTVEIREARLTDRQKKWFVQMHVIGTSLFAAVLASVGFELSVAQKWYLSGCFLAAAILLFPLHIYLALKRKIQLQKSPPAKDL